MANLTPLLTLALWLTSLGTSGAQEITKPVGRWERKIGKSHVTLVVEENRLHATFVGEKSCALHADYAMTRDGVVYGVVTSIDCDEDEDSAKAMFDAPFSCRFRIDEGALIVHDLKCHEADSKDDVWNGRFKAVGQTSARASVPTTCPACYPMYSSPSAAPPGGNNPLTPASLSTSQKPETTFYYWNSFCR